MSDLVKRLRATIRYDAINGSAEERAVCTRQIREAADRIEALEQRLAAATEAMQIAADSMRSAGWAFDADELEEAIAAARAKP